MSNRQIVALWSGLLLLVSASLLLLNPITNHMLLPMLEAFPGMERTHADAYVLAFGHLVTWYLSVVVVLVSLGTASAVALGALTRLFASGSRARFLAPGALAGIAVMLFVWNGFLGAPTDDVLRSVVRVVGEGYWQGIEHLENGARRVAAAGTSASIVIFITMVGLTWSSTALHKTSDVGLALAIVKDRVATLKYLLYLAGAGLAGGVVATAMNLSLHVDVTQTDDGVAVARALVRHASLAYGGAFTLLLILGYVPAALVLGQWSRRLSQQALPRLTSAEQQAWRRQNDLESPLTSQVWQFVALLAPFLTSVLGEPVTRVVTGLFSG